MTITDSSAAATSPPSRMPVLAAAGRPAQRPGGAAHLSDAQVAELGRELDAIRAEIIDDLGADDAAYIRGMIRTQRALEVAGRLTLLFARNKAAFVAGTGMLTMAKVLGSMEIGHNVIHGQWDWMRDPDIHSTNWEWDFVTPAASWKHTHNDIHHTYTNVVGKDRDVGYSVLRVSREQPWEPRFLLNLPTNFFLAPFFEWGIASYDLELDEVRAGRKSTTALKRDLKALGRKFVQMIAKDYAGTPLAAQLVSRSGKSAMLGTFLANTLRNYWAHTVIFCGHFPDEVESFPEESIEGETRGDWYIRQMLGSANLEGGRLFHILTGNLSHQIEHHLFPDLPSNRYGQIAPKVREICQRYGLKYTTGPLHRQIAQTWRTLARLSLPDHFTGRGSVGSQRGAADQVTSTGRD